MLDTSHRQADEGPSTGTRDAAAPKLTVELERRVGQFLREMSHELGNLAFPLQVILDLQGQSQPLSPEELRAALQGHLTELLTITRRLQRIGRCICPDFEPHVEVMRLSEVIEGAIADCRPALDRQRLTLRVEPRDSLQMVRADPDLLQLALTELIDNAARFSPAGGRIDITTDAQDRSLEIQVRDHGSGVPPQLQSGLFDLFVQGAPRLDFAAGRIGVGLTIVARVAAAHGGRAELRRTSADGSEFVITLPPAA